LVAGDVVSGRRYASESAAIQAVLAVFEVVVDVLSTRRTRPHRLQQLGGPDSKTTRRLLDGHGTQP
jgi:hypothetical protein